MEISVNVSNENVLSGHRLPQGHMAFVEVKSPGEKPRALQLLRHRLLKRLGFKVYVLDSKADIRKIIEEVQNETA